MPPPNTADLFGMPYSYKYPHPAVTADIVVFGYGDGQIRVLLIQRGAEPFKNRWAFPGGFVNIAEAPAAAARELKEETGLSGIRWRRLGSSALRPRSARAGNQHRLQWGRQDLSPPCPRGERRRDRWGGSRWQHRRDWLLITGKFCGARFHIGTRRSRHGSGPGFWQRLFPLRCCGWSMRRLSDFLSTRNYSARRC